MGKAVPLSVRREVAVRHGGRVGDVVRAGCARCGRPGQIAWPVDRRSSYWVSFPGLELDHVIPRRKLVLDDANALSGKV